ncbi:MAG: DUF4445 domain-containing protein [Lachnospiraceae bacterium]|nr:DUF4445 domain-containing protein [Lachnospiraceae bacterium]
MSSIILHIGKETQMLSVPAGAPVLPSILSSEFFLSHPSTLDMPCGGIGTCGKCLVPIRQNGFLALRKLCAATAREGMEIFLEASPSASSTNVDAVERFDDSSCCDEKAPLNSEKTNRSDEEVLHSAAMPRGTGDTFSRSADHVRHMGAAVDLGTTTLEVKVFDLTTGECLGAASDWSALAPFGADVISRIKYIQEHPEGSALLGTLCRRQCMELICSLLPQGTRPEIMTVAGNTIMEHIFAGLDPSPMAVYPFEAPTLFREDKTFTFPECGECRVTLMPCISAYVGGDITAGILVTQLKEKPGALLADIGTNGELVLNQCGRLLCCSTACGPAFEGASIRCGMRAVPGAVSHIRYENGQWLFDLISAQRNSLTTAFSPESSSTKSFSPTDSPEGSSPADSFSENSSPMNPSSDDTAPVPKGFCGSGLVDLLKELLSLGIVDETGRLLSPDDLASPPSAFSSASPSAFSPAFPSDFLSSFLSADDDGNGIFHLPTNGDKNGVLPLDADGDENGVLPLDPDGDKNSFLSQSADGGLSLYPKDVRQLQLAKAAVCAGVETLLQKAGMTSGELTGIELAGGFGKHLNIPNLLAIGMLPPVPGDLIRAVGNTSLAGAERLLLHPESATQLVDIVICCETLELSLSPEFTDFYVDAMMFQSGT